MSSAYRLPAGFMSAGIHAGFKKNGKPDAGLIYSDKPCVTAGFFTSNRLKSWHIIHAKKRINAPVRAVFANSGNANVFNGRGGKAALQTIIGIIARGLSISPENILAASTGKISLDMPVKKIAPLISKLPGLLSANDRMFPRAIMTTDLTQKVFTERVKINGKNITVTGVAKGSGMLAPNMATMLAFIMTDAVVEKRALYGAAKEAVAETFNRVTVDGDMSPNDTVYVLANGRAGNKKIRKGGAGYGALKAVFLKGFYGLAEEMASDGEGATKLIKIIIRGAKSRARAEKAARAVANSPLVKTNFFGEAVNIGRIVSAVGMAGVQADLKKTLFLINGVAATNGERVINHGRLALQMKKKRIELVIDMKQGRHGCFLLTCDYSYDYIRINADYS